MDVGKPALCVHAADQDLLHGDQGVAEMRRIGAHCDPKITDCRPHRLRDTFAVRALLKGIPLEDVSKLLGHQSVAVTEKYYAPWIASRKRRLERLLFETLVEAKGS